MRSGEEARPLRVVITGGPGSGKTTLVEALGARGWPTVPEAAIQVIAELNERMGLEEQKAWRRAHVEEFQRLVLARQDALERAAAGAGGAAVFFDRGVVDGLGYCRHFGRPVPAELAAAAREDRYDRVFLLDTLPDYVVRSDTGRTSDRAQSLRIRDHVAAVYAELGLEPVPVPVASVEERVRIVLDALGLPERAP